MQQTYECYKSILTKLDIYVQQGPGMEIEADNKAYEELRFNYGR